MQKNIKPINTIHINKTSIISIIILTSFVIITYLFYSLNRYIKQIFDENKQVNTKILTDIIKIKPNSSINKETILEILNKLNYSNITSFPLNEGEYFVKLTTNKNENDINTPNEVLYIFRRNIKTDKYNFPKTLYKIDFKNKHISCIDEKLKDMHCKEFILEPLPLASNKNLQDKVEYKKLSEFNKTLIDTVILIEDKRFYKHIGIDIKGILRALYVNTIYWKTRQGASTLTQQLVKNMFLDNRRNFLRKVKEAFLSLYIECIYSKDEILEKYLNTIYLGQDGNTAIKGFHEASKFYFNKNINELTLSQIATLVGMIKAPSGYSPILNYKASLNRRNVVLKKLLDEKYISNDDYLIASTQIIKLDVKREKETTSNYFYDALKVAIPAKYFKEQSYITTGINPLFQICAKNAINDELKNIKARSNIKDIEASLITIDSETGIIISYIGGTDYNKSQFDRVRQGKRQIGSLIKPFIYLAALDPKLNNYKQATPLSILDDKPITLLASNKKKWTPQNYDKKFRGFVTLREALENSLNIPTINLSLKIGLKTIVDILNKVNIKNINDKNLAIALGAIDLSLLDITSAYTTFSNNGHFISPRFYSEIYDSKNNILKRSNIIENDIASKEATFILNKILQGVLIRGTAKSASKYGFNLEFAGKTGTSDSQRDNWFIGYNTKYVTGVWVGRDNNSKMPFTGATTALPIWANYTSCILQYTNDYPFIMPSNVKETLIDKLTYDECKEPQDLNCYKEYFIKNTSSQNSIKKNNINVKKIARDRNFFDIVE